MRHCRSGRLRNLAAKRVAIARWLAAHDLEEARSQIQAALSQR